MVDSEVPSPHQLLFLCSRVLQQMCLIFLQMFLIFQVFSLPVSRDTSGTHKNGYTSSLRTPKFLLAHHILFNLVLFLVTTVTSNPYILQNFPRSSALATLFSLSNLSHLMNQFNISLIYFPLKSPPPTPAVLLSCCHS